MRRRRRAKRRGRRATVVAATKRVLPSRRFGSLLRGAGIALAVVLFTGMGDAAPARKAPPVTAPRVTAPSPKPVVTPPAHAVSLPVPVEPPAWGAALAPVSVTNRNTGTQANVRLYSEHGSLELPALKEFMRVASSAPDAEEPEPLDARLVQLAVRASYHFAAAPIVIVSATRKGAHGKHGSGEALDFKLDGVSASELATYVRTFPRAGIGIYTHPKTQYVHVDVRAHSYHWVDGSPPGVTWREQLLQDPTQEARDASYVGAMDLPEVASD